LAAPATQGSAPYTAAQIRRAYGFDQLPLNGSGQIIAVIDAYDDPTIGQDLATFDRAMGLPNAPLVKAVPSTGTPPFDPGWAGEIALDVEWAHAIAPASTILLVEAPSATMNDMVSGVDFAVTAGANQISMSWGGSSYRGQAAYDGHFDHPGVSILTASGDNGAGAGYPASSPFVTSVGGTNLVLDPFGHRVSETAWAGSGGGVTSFASKPSYQNGFISGRRRATPDVAYDADPATGYLVYDTSSGGGWYVVGGTSAGAPQWAGLFALANQGRAASGKAPVGSGLRYGTNQVLYALAGGSGYSNANGDFFNIVGGSNGYAATPGYNLVDGLGSPVANRLVPDLIDS
jgi:subtilase family serine protease